MKSSHLDFERAECGGIEPPRPHYGRKPVLKTGRATRPTHSTDTLPDYLSTTSALYGSSLYGGCNGIRENPSPLMR